MRSSIFSNFLLLLVELAFLSHILAQPSENVPIVLMHGMGDAAGNSGMQQIKKKIAKHLETYVTNVQIGHNIKEDTENSFFMTLDVQVNYFATIVRKDPNLQKGFYALGFSQGNLVIRGYIEKFNDPPVKRFISVHGPLAGVGSLPRCKPTAYICKEINKIVSSAAYSKKIQEHLAQANYFRDPFRIQEYKENALFLPDINNEKASMNSTYKTNFAKLEELILVKAKKDTMVFPSDSEWFGAYEDESLTKILRFNETEWYLKNTFGLRTLHEQKKVYFYTTSRNHLQFKDRELMAWVTAHFKPKEWNSEKSIHKTILSPSAAIE